MDEIVLYGASDDLIEVESTSFRDEEFNVNLDRASDSVILAVSDGTLLRVRYDEEGIWRFTPVVIGSASVSINHATYDGDNGSYTDRVTLVGDDLHWVMLGTQLAK